MRSGTQCESDRNAKRNAIRSGIHCEAECNAKRNTIQYNAKRNAKQNDMQCKAECKAKWNTIRSGMQCDAECNAKQRNNAMRSENAMQYKGELSCETDFNDERSGSQTSSCATCAVCLLQHRLRCVSAHICKIQTVKHTVDTHPTSNTLLAPQLRHVSAHLCVRVQRNTDSEAHSRHTLDILLYFSHCTCVTYPRISAGALSAPLSSCLLTLCTLEAPPKCGSEELLRKCTTASWAGNLRKGKDM
jgi:hypothetical protein